MDCCDDGYTECGRPTEINATITVNAPPTTDTVRVLRELEDAAEKRILERHTIQSNWFNGNLIRFTDEAANQTVLRVLFKLNGRDYFAESRLNPGEDKHKIYDDLARATSEKLTAAILSVLDQKGVY